MPDSDAILIVLSSHGQLGDTGRPTGFYLPEAAHPWRVFTDAGLRVDLVSPAGGTPPMDGVDLDDPVQQEFLDDPEMSSKLAATMTPDEVDPAAYAAIFFAGGHGTMWDFPDDPLLPGLASTVWAGGGVVAALCHGPAGLIGVVDEDGAPLVAGRSITAFSNAEEEAAGLTGVVPFALQSRLESLGADHTAAANFTEHAVTDGRLVTGQNPASAAATAKAVLAALDARHASAAREIA